MTVSWLYEASSELRSAFHTVFSSVYKFSKTRARIAVLPSHDRLQLLNSSLLQQSPTGTSGTDGNGGTLSVGGYNRGPIPLPSQGPTNPAGSEYSFVATQKLCGWIIRDEYVPVWHEWFVTHASNKHRTALTDVMEGLRTEVSLAAAPPPTTYKETHFRQFARPRTPIKAIAAIPKRLEGQPPPVSSFPLFALGARLQHKEQSQSQQQQQQQQQQPERSPFSPVRRSAPSSSWNSNQHGASPSFPLDAENAAEKQKTGPALHTVALSVFGEKKREVKSTNPSSSSSSSSSSLFFAQPGPESRAGMGANPKTMLASSNPFLTKHKPYFTTGTWIPTAPVFREEFTPSHAVPGQQEWDREVKTRDTYRAATAVYVTSPQGRRDASATGMRSWQNIVSAGEKGAFDKARSLHDMVEDLDALGSTLSLAGSRCSSRAAARSGTLLQSTSPLSVLSSSSTPLAGSPSSRRRLSSAGTRKSAAGFHETERGEDEDDPQLLHTVMGVLAMDATGYDPEKRHYGIYNSMPRNTTTFTSYPTFPSEVARAARPNAAAAALVVGATFPSGPNGKWSSGFVGVDDKFASRSSNRNEPL
eukprot:ANDGO_06477.mRNA.1 hypothetical protein